MEVQNEERERLRICRFDLIQGVQIKPKVEGWKVRSRPSCSLILCAEAPGKASYVTVMLAAHRGGHQGRLDPLYSANRNGPPSLQRF